MSKYQFGDDSNQVDVEVLHGELELNKLKAPSSSGGSTRSAGTDGQVLKTNGVTIYWGDTEFTDAQKTKLIELLELMDSETIYIA